MSVELKVNLGEESVERLPVPEVEPGTEAQLREFFHKYVNHERASTKCYLDGRYFWKVLSSYGGLVPSEMYVRINQRPAVPAPEILTELPLDTEDLTTASLANNLQTAVNVQVTPFQLLLTFDGEDLSRTKCYPERYRLIKLIIDIAEDPEEVRGVVHSNLIYIDTKKKTVKRFEPLFDAPYLHPVDKALKAFFNENLPEYHYTMSPEHPQKPGADSCASKGMCAAFVLKKAMLLLAHNPHRHECVVDYQEEKGLLRRWLGSWSHKKDKRHQHREFIIHSQADYDREEAKILQFADAIEAEYGPIPGVPEIEFGPGDGTDLASGLAGFGLGALTGAALSGGLGTTAYYPYSYPAVAGPYNYLNCVQDPYFPGQCLSYPPVYSYGPSIVIGGRPYSRSWGYSGRPWRRRHDHDHDRDGRRDRDWDRRRSWSPRSPRRSQFGLREENGPRYGGYGYGGYSNPAVTGGLLGAGAGLLLGGGLEGALLGGLLGGGLGAASGGYLLGDPYSPQYHRRGWRHHHGRHRYYRW